MPRGVSPVDEAMVQRRLWTPAEARPALWLDTFDLSTISTASGAVSEWQDKSGNGRHFTQGVAANRPTFDSGLQPQSILWDGVNDALQRSVESWAYVYPVSFFVSLRAVAWTNAYNGALEFYTSNSPNEITTAGWGLFIKSNGKSGFFTNDTTNTQRYYDGTGALTFATGTTNILCGHVGNGFINTWGNGAVDGSLSGTWTQRTNLGSGNVEVGSDARFGRWTNWRIREAIIFTGASLTTAFRQRMEGYMAWRAASFGDITALNNLPASHPFRNRPPLIGD
jgi:hypothetical protein